MKETDKKARKKEKERRRGKWWRLGLYSSSSGHAEKVTHKLLGSTSRQLQGSHRQRGESPLLTNSLPYYRTWYLRRHRVASWELSQSSPFCIVCPSSTWLGSLAHRFLSWAMKTQYFRHHFCILGYEKILRACTCWRFFHVFSWTAFCFCLPCTSRGLPVEYWNSNTPAAYALYVASKKDLQIACFSR